jgi:ribosomal protein L7/L12
MRVTLDSNSVFTSTFDLRVGDVPAEKAAQLHTDVTALVFGFKCASSEPQFTSTQLESFIVQMQSTLRGRINAIKAVRCLTGLGFKEAKDFVDDVVARNQLTFDGGFPPGF